MEKHGKEEMISLYHELRVLLGTVFVPKVALLWIFPDPDCQGLFGQK